MLRSTTEYKGVLEVHGPISFDQFYYQGGESDADTVKIQLDSMRFRPSEQAEWLEDLHTFDDAVIRGKKVIRDEKITIRLQGIDAPELHYGTHWFRQHWGARAVKELENLLEPYVNGSRNTIDAYVYTWVDHPNDVFDIYGRFIGDIIIVKDNKNVNHWLVEEGWAFPTFYNSMSKQEISILNSKSKSAQNNSKGIWNRYSDKLVPFEYELQTARGRNAERIEAATDNGNLNLPKLFRRQVDYNEGGNADGKSFVDYLIERNDEFYLTKDFLERRTNAELHKFSETIDENGNIKFEPDEFVFVENTLEVLKDSNGNRIEQWQ
jgi:endonuclease YncB( thermonuclease family)